MGAPKPKVVHYDASKEQAAASQIGIDLMKKAQDKAYESSTQTSLLSQEAVSRVQEGVGLLGEYLKSRNLSMTNQIPLDTNYRNQMTNLSNQYIAKAGSLFGGQ
jgi:hypothetical protein